MQRSRYGNSQSANENVMKKLFFILMALPIFAFKCSKSSNKDDVYLEGKVIGLTCSVVMQVLNDDTIGEDGWKNNNVVYDNVFTINNSCGFSEKFATGKTIRFKINAAAPNECVYCFVYDGHPMTNYTISDVSVIEGH
jgi:hypothetical protein